MRKKIWLSLDAWYPQMAGPNVVVTNYKNILQRTNDCKLFVTSYGKKLDAEGDKKTGVDVVHVKSVNIFFGGYRNTLPQNDNKVKQLLKEGVDIFHSHSPFGLGHYFAKQARKLGVPSIVTLHTKFRDDFVRCTHSRALTAFMMRRIMKVINETDYVWTVSNGAVETLREYGYKGDVTVIRNGTDMTMPNNAQQLVDEVNRQYHLQDEENVFLFVGRIVSTKNLPLVFDALSKLKQRNLPFKMLVVGGGEELHNYRKLTESMGIGDRVIFVGQITDREFLKAFYLRADLFLFPSVYDTASLCPIEAATFSLPALLIKDSQTAETVKDGFSGYCAVEDSSVWADKIEEIITDKQKLKQVSDNCRKYVYRSWEDVVQEVEGHYDQLLGANK